MPESADDHRTEPDPYEVQSMLVSREVWRGMVAAYEIRVGHAEAIIKDLREQIAKWRTSATGLRDRAARGEANDKPILARTNRAVAGAYDVAAVQAEAIINGTRTPGKTSYELSTELRDRIVERTAHDLEHVGGPVRVDRTDSGPWVNAPLSVVVGLMLAEGTHRP